MKKTIKNQRGIALIITVIALLFMSIIGVAILGITSSNSRLTNMDRKNQSTFYIAEAGANYMMREMRTWIEERESTMDSETFFQQLNNHFTRDVFTLDDFHINAGEQPVASITVNQVATN